MVRNMSISRRVFFAGLTVSGLSACSSGPVPQGRTTTAAPRAVRNPEFDIWLAQFRGRAAGHGISARVLSTALVGAGFLPEVLNKDRNQTEFVRSLEDNIALAASDERIRVGKAKLARHGALLAGLEARYGVEAEVITAIWGHESIYGERRGNIPVLSSLATLAYGGRRRGFFEAQLIAALKIVQAGEVSPANMLGSWAGAMGHTQFIPTTYRAYAQDYHGDGRRDIWSDDPTDALASAASYLHRSGWRKGHPWGVEIRLSDGRDMRGRVVPDYGASSVLTPAGRNGPAFKVFKNYHVFRRYNNAMKYAIAVGHLSDRLAGKPAIQGHFAPDAQGLNLSNRKEIQRRLAAKGFYQGIEDGVIGPKTIASIRAYQAAKGLAQDGLASKALLAHLR